MEVRDEFHRRQVELASIFCSKNGGEVLSISNVKFLLRQPGKERADHVIDLRSHHHTVLQIDRRGGWNERSCGGLGEDANRDQQGCH